MLYLWFSGYNFFLVTAIIKLFIGFWGFDSSYIKLIHKYKDIKYCCFYIVSARLCLSFGVFDFPLGVSFGDDVEYCNALVILLVAFEIQMDCTGKVKWEEYADSTFVRGVR